MPELSDLPIEILLMIAESCEPRPRFNLRSTSKLMKEVVDQSKFFLNSLEWSFYDSLLLKITFGYKIGDIHTTSHEIKVGIENANAIEKAGKWMAIILNNAEIGFFRIMLDYFAHRLTKDLTKDFLQKVKENLKSPLKARTIHCECNIDPFWICDKSYCKRLTCSLVDPDFFQEYKEILMNLDNVWIWQTMNITDQDVLSMKATYINLKSEIFSAEMINQMVDKFIAKGLFESEFSIENPKANFISKIKIPDGFIASTEKHFRSEHEKIVGDKKMTLSVRKESVWFEITQLIS